MAVVGSGMFTIGGSGTTRSPRPGGPRPAPFMVKVGSVSVMVWALMFSVAAFTTTVEGIVGRPGWAPRADRRRASPWRAGCAVAGC